MGCAVLKQELLIIQVHKFGKVKNMDENVIYGQQDVFFMNYALYILLLELKIFQDYIEK